MMNFVDSAVADSIAE